MSSDHVVEGVETPVETEIDAVLGEGGDDWAIRLEGASKVYKVYDRPLDRVWELFGRRRHREFNALAPISLTVRQATTLGIVGDNGAGKSTLMHLLVGSHQPTTGSVTRRGKVLGLLELGVGFHLEFSGRDNIYFHGDMLGLERSFVKQRFDEIVAFAELQDFIDLPLRTYSTGMRMRLAFALVASLDPDVLIVDEALAVGDMHFQKKCIDRMMAFRRAGKTIVLCSHSLYHIGIFCDEVLWMKGGQVHKRGTPQEVLPVYEAYQLAKEERAQTVAGGASAFARIERLTVESPLPMDTGDDLRIRWQVAARDNVAFHVSFSLKMDDGRGVFVTGSLLQAHAAMHGQVAGELSFPAVPLMGGVYSIHMRVWDDAGLVLYAEERIPEIVVRRQGDELGLVRLPCEWRYLTVSE